MYVVFTHTCLDVDVHDEAKIKTRTRLETLVFLSARHLIVKTTPTRTGPIVILIQRLEAIGTWRALAFDQLNELPLQTKYTEDSG